MSATAVRIASFEPPCQLPTTPWRVGHEPQLAPGVRGYAVEWRGRIMIPLIVAEQEGSGDVGRFLDSLAPRCCVVGVISLRLAGMLKRRGYVRTMALDYFDEITDVWQRQAVPS